MPKNIPGVVRRRHRRQPELAPIYIPPPPLPADTPPGQMPSPSAFNQPAMPDAPMQPPPSPAYNTPMQVPPAPAQQSPSPTYNAPIQMPPVPTQQSPSPTYNPPMQASPAPVVQSSSAYNNAPMQTLPPPVQAPSPTPAPHPSDRRAKGDESAHNAPIQTPPTVAAPPPQDTPPHLEPLPSTVRGPQSIPDTPSTVRGPQPVVPDTPPARYPQPAPSGVNHPPVTPLPAHEQAATIRPGQEQSAPVTGSPGGPPSGAINPPVARILVKIDGNLAGEARLNKPMLTIGRREGNDIHIAHPGVSRLHARIQAERGIWVIEDADSANGMMYQGQRIKRLALSNGDVIMIAPNVALRFETAP